MTTISAPSSKAGICSDVMSGLRLMRTGGSPDLFSGSKITASDSLASTNSPRTEILRFLSGSDAGERQHRMHQHVGPRRAISLGCVLELVMADAVLARHEHHRRGHDGVEIAGIVAGAGGDAPVRIAECLGGIFHRIDQLCIEMRRRLV